MQNQRFKAKIPPLSERRRAEQPADKKSGIREIICPDNYSPIWQKAFALADNVRFTRTPDCELRRRRAALDPVYAKILAEAEAARAALKSRAEAEAPAEAEAAAPAEAAPIAENRGYDNIEKMREEAAAAFAAPAPAAKAEEAEPAAAAEMRAEAAPETLAETAPATAPITAKIQAEGASAVSAAAPAAAETKTEIAEIAPAAEAKAAAAPAAAVFPWEIAAPDSGPAFSAAGAAEYFRAAALPPAGFAAARQKTAAPAGEAAAAVGAPAEPASAPASAPAPAKRFAAAQPAAAESAPRPRPANISALFKTLECRQPQMRWIPVPAEAVPANALPAAAAKAAGAANAAAEILPRSAFITGAGGFASPALNLQVKVENYGYGADSANAAAEGRSAAPQAGAEAAPRIAVQLAPAAAAAAAAPNAALRPTAGAAQNLDVLCSSAVEKAGAAGDAAWDSAAADIAPPPAGAADNAAIAARAAREEAENRAAIARAAAPEQAAAAAAANAAPHRLPHAAPVPAAKYSYQLPSLELLQQPDYHDGNIISQETLERSAGLLESILEDFGVKGEIIQVRPGPVVTLYEFEPAPGVKSSRIIGLAEDIARSMSAVSARVAVIPGRNAIGIELPNKKREMVYLREILQSQAFKTSEYKLPLALGKNIGGEPIIAELAKMPHLLVAGTTGSGKSVAINTMILSLLYRMPPSRCRLIMVDPKMLELSIYDGIPHLLTPVVTDPKKALSALKWAVREMEERYRKMAKLGVRNIDGFNARVKDAAQKGETIMCTVQAGFDKETGELLYTEEAMDLTPLPYIVIIVDEMADLMMVAGKEIEGAIQRLAQMARAAGIHLIMATQRPSVDVITGTIKANFPTRISFQVTSKIDSRTILGEQGAEALLGQGDMLHMAGGGRLKRVHGPFVSDREVEKVVAHLKSQGTPEYLATVTESNEEDEAKGKEEEPDSVAEIVAAAGGGNDDFDDLYVQAVKTVMRDKKCSTSYIQRRLGIGYNKAATLVEKMEEEGLVGEANHVGKREILLNS